VAALVFGVGYLGAALVAALLVRGRDVVGVDNGFATDWAAIERLRDASAGRFRLLRGDVRAESDVEATFGAASPIDCVYLLAAQASAHPDAAPAEYTEDTNLRGPRLVFAAALAHGAPPVVYGSSFHVYGTGHRSAVDESHPYGTVRDLSHLSKIYAEKLGEMVAATRGLAVAPVRLGVVYGVSPVTKRDLHFVTVPHAFCLRALAGQPLEVNAGATAPIGFVHVDDAVDALLLAGASASGTGYAPANAVSEVATVRDVAGCVTRAAATHGVSARVVVPAPPAAPGAPAPAFTVPSRLAALGWRPRRRLEDAVPEVFAYYQAMREAVA
jgi:nucleoside-diphosphate-sugar epimerase